MFIGILLGAPEIHGGTYVIYEHGSRLKHRGHRVAVITREAVKPEQYAWHPGASELEWFVLEEAEKLAFDVVIATWWESAFLLHKFSVAHCVYFVQSIESRFFPPEDSTNHDARDNGIRMQLCESTYTYAIPMITEARWIKKYLYENFNSHARLVPNGIRKDIYRPDGRACNPRKKKHMRVLVEGLVGAFYKNVPKTIALCRKAGVEDIWLMTASEVSEYPGVDRVFSQVPIERTSEIYRSCDVLVKLSYVEGMFGPPLEMFHCGGTAIVYDVTGHDEYILHRKNSYVVKRDDEERVIELLKRLCRNEDELTRLKAGALETARNWPDWEASSRKFEDALEEIHATAPPTSRHYLKQYTRQLWDDNQNRLNAKESELFARREINGRDSSTDDFVQLYWHSGEGFNQHDFKWARCRTGKWTTLDLAIRVSSTPFHIRVDPSVRIGVTAIGLIEIADRLSKKIMVRFDSGRQIKDIACGGTGRWITSSGQNAFLFSYGPDPQLFLPPIKTIEPGMELVIRIKLKAMSIHRFLEEHSIVLPQPLNRRWKRLLMKAAGKTADMLSSAGRFLLLRQ